MASDANPFVVQLRKEYSSVEPKNTQSNQIKISNSILRHFVMTDKKEKNAKDKEDVHKEMYRIFAQVEQMILK